MTLPDTPCVVRPAIDEDATTLLSLLAQLGYPCTAAEVSQRLLAMNATEPSVLVAVADQRLLGVIGVQVTPMLHRPHPVGRITTLVVTAEARGLGVGSRLVAAAEQLLAQRGCKVLELTSNVRRTEAHAFYARLGYQATSSCFRKTLE